jgi:predicted cation transporter|tara:strand:- start:143 stop:379 length:237 start_codon:yes stop_codon:yes gene_type:complete
MEILNKVKTWAGALAEVGISVAALMIVLEVLGLSSTVMPFLPTASVISNVSGIIAMLGAQGLVGLVAVWVLYEIWNRK